MESKELMKEIGGTEIPDGCVAMLVWNFDEPVIIGLFTSPAPLEEALDQTLDEYFSDEEEEDDPHYKGPTEVLEVHILSLDGLYKEGLIL